MKDLLENEYYGEYAVRCSNGYDEDWEYYDSEVKARDTFIYAQGYNDDIYLYQYNKELGYEVIDSWNS